jgi:restriction system protein
MARKPKTSPAEDLLDIIAMLPWWMGLVLGLVAYVVLHHVAEPATAVAPVTTAQGMAGLAIDTLWRSLALFGQYLIPVICMLGAAASAFRRHHRMSLLRGVCAANGSHALNDMTWQDFELMIGEWFRKQGYVVGEVGGGGADGGVDLILRKNGERFLVQCKQWRASKVGVGVVRELYGVMAAQGAVGGFVVSSGTYTADAKSFAQGRNVLLIDGDAVMRILRQKDNGDREQTNWQPVATPQVTDMNRLQACPLCGSPMVKRRAARGPNAGLPFFGCSTYPACKGTVSIDTPT